MAGVTRAQHILLQQQYSLVESLIILVLIEPTSNAQRTVDGYFFVYRLTLTVNLIAGRLNIYHDRWRATIKHTLRAECV